MDEEQLKKVLNRRYFDRCINEIMIPEIAHISLDVFQLNEIISVYNINEMCSIFGEEYILKVDEETLSKIMYFMPEGKTKELLQVAGNNKFRWNR